MVAPVIIPPTSKKLIEHIGFGLSVRPSVCPFVMLFDACHILWTMHARVLKFHIWIPHGTIADPFFFFLFFLSFFLVRVISLSGVIPLWEIRMKCAAWHTLRTVHTRVLKFHIWISHGKISDPYFFSCPSYLPFWSYAPLKKSEWNLVSKISQKLFKLGNWNLVSW